MGSEEILDLYYGDRPYGWHCSVMGHPSSLFLADTVCIITLLSLVR